MTYLRPFSRATREDDRSADVVAGAGRLSGIVSQDQLSERALNPVLWSQIKIAASLDKLDFDSAVKTLELYDDREYFHLCVGCEQSAAGLPVQDASLKVLDRRLDRLRYYA